MKVKPYNERQKGDYMTATMLDPSKLTAKERQLRKKYIEDLISLKLEEFEELKKEGEKRIQRGFY